MDSVPNPYAAPTATTDVPITMENDWMSVRRAHIAAEANIKSIGLLDYLGGAVVLFGAVTSLLGRGITPESIGFMFGMCTMGTVMIFVGIRLRQLRPGARIAQTVLLVVGGLSSLASLSALTSLSALGNLFWSAVIALILWSRKASVVFSEHYRTVVIPATPTVKYRISVVTVIFVVLLILALFGVFAAVVLGPRH